MAGRGLDDAALRGWCAWARGALSRFGAAAERSQPMRAPFILDFSSNAIGDAGVADLADLFQHGLQNVRVRILKLHRNRLGPGAAAPLASLLERLGANRERRCVPEELHLSHNQLGKTGIITVLEGIARAGVGNDLPAYPLQVGAAGYFRPLWLRVEYNGQPDQSPEEFIAEVSVQLAALRRVQGWLPIRSPAQMLCLGKFGQSKRCTVENCRKQKGHEGPIAHLNCWGGTSACSASSRSDLPSSRVGWAGAADVRLDSRICFEEDLARSKRCPWAYPDTTQLAAPAIGKRLRISAGRPAKAPLAAEAPDERRSTRLSRLCSHLEAAVEVKVEASEVGRSCSAL